MSYRLLHRVVLTQVGARAQQSLSVVPAQVLGGAVQQKVVGQQVVVKGLVAAQRNMLQ